MANRWKNNLTTTTVTVPSSTKYTGRADGMWGLNSQIQSIKSGAWTTSSVVAPPAPTITLSSAGDTLAKISYTIAADVGGGTIVSYTVTDSTNTFTAVGLDNPLTVTGLTNGTQYSFKIKAISNYGDISPWSSLGVSVTPIASFMISGGYDVVTAYTWSDVNGVGSAYPAPSPAAGAGYGMYINDLSTAVVLSGLLAYPWTSGGFGTRFTPPAEGSSGTYFAMNKSFTGAMMLVGGIKYFPFSVSTGFGTATATGTATNASGIINNPNDPTYFCVSYGTTPGLQYRWVNGSVISAANNWSSTQAGAVAVNSMVFNTTSNVIFYVDQTANYLYAQTMSGTTWGSRSSAAYTQYASGPVSVNSAGTAVAFRAEAIYLGGYNSGVNIFRWSGSWGTVFSKPAGMLTNGKISWNKRDTVISIDAPYGSGNTSQQYAWSNSTGCGTKYSSVGTSFNPQSALFNT